MRAVWSTFGSLSLVLTHGTACNPAVTTTTSGAGGSGGENAAPWACDGFGEDGVVKLAQVTEALDVTPDGKLIAFGMINLGWGGLKVLRVLADGSRDLEYPQFFDPDFNPIDVAVDATGRAIFSGYRGWPVIEGMLVRLLDDGSVDEPFGIAAEGIYGGITVGADRVVVTSEDTVTVLGQDGAPDPAFGLGGSVDIGFFEGWRPAWVQQTGKILLFREQGGDLVLMRLDASGALDPSFGSGGVVDAVVVSVALDAEDRILVKVCDADPCNSTSLQRLTADGQLDMTFGEGGMVPDVRGGLRVLPDGRIVLFGVGGTISRRLPNGELDVTFGEQGTLNIDWVDGVSRRSAIGDDGRIFVAIVGTDHLEEEERSDESTLYCITPDGHD